MTNSLARVAVYGSLRHGHGNWSRLLNRDPIQTIEIPNFKMFSLGGFPGVLHSPDVKDRVTVEIYEVDDSDLSRLDGLEGYRAERPEHSMYLRERVEETDSYIYVWNGRNLPEETRVISGDWNEHVNSRVNRR